MYWFIFKQNLGAKQHLPPENKYVLVKSKEGKTAVGYIHFAAGCKDSPVFTIPGVGFDVVAWYDYLSEDFVFPAI